MLIYKETKNSENNKTSSMIFNLRKKISRMFFSFLGRFLPKKTKRLIFLSSFIASANQITNPSKTMLAKINDLLNISGIDEAIALPMALGCKMWKCRLSNGIYLENLRNPLINIDQLKNKELNSAELRITANTIICCSPRWLMYDSKRIMRADIVLLLSSLPQIAEAA